MFGCCFRYSGHDFFYSFNSKFVSKLLNIANINCKIQIKCEFLHIKLYFVSIPFRSTFENVVAIVGPILCFLISVSSSLYSDLHFHLSVVIALYSTSFGEFIKFRSLLKIPHFTCFMNWQISNFRFLDIDVR